MAVQNFFGFPRVDVDASHVDGVQCMRLALQGKTASEQIADLEMSVDLIRSETSAS